MKKVVLLFLAVVVLAYIAGMFSKQNLQSNIIIHAPPGKVWQHLVDFEKYPDWNPFIKKISGKLAVGSKIQASIQLPGNDAMEFNPELLVVKPNQELRWLGKLYIPKLFDGEHYFLLKENPNGTTNFVQGENFSGILALLLLGSIEQQTRQGFDAMNQALKALSESDQASSASPAS